MAVDLGHPGVEEEEGWGRGWKDGEGEEEIEISHLSDRKWDLTRAAVTSAAKVINPCRMGPNGEGCPVERNE